MRRINHRTRGNVNAQALACVRATSQDNPSAHTHAHNNKPSPCSLTNLVIGPDVGKVNVSVDCERNPEPPAFPGQSVDASTDYR